MWDVGGSVVGRCSSVVGSRPSLLSVVVYRLLVGPSIGPGSLASRVLPPESVRHVEGESGGGVGRAQGGVGGWDWMGWVRECLTFGVTSIQICEIVWVLNPSGANWGTELDGRALVSNGRRGGRHVSLKTRVRKATQTPWGRRATGHARE